MADQYFHFTLGPVQSFVAQARRTRDFWAGSFLLSWLSGVAMVAVKAQGGDIVFPVPDERFLAAIRGEQGTEAAPKQGSIPNRFMAKVDENFQPDAVINTVHAAWEGLADLIWREDLRGRLKGDQCAISQQIWQRQVQSCWEISWVLTDDVKASNLLDRRKNWRSHLPPPEPGVKCMMMAGLQELSGIAQPHATGLTDFWQRLNGGMLGLGLRQREYLSAIGFIKRRFVHHFQQLKLQCDGCAIHGWTLAPNVPSTSWIAASFWQAAVINQCTDNPALQQAVAELARAGVELNGKPDGKADTACINRARAAAKLQKFEWPQDGESLFKEALITAMGSAECQRDQDYAQQALDALVAVSKLTELPNPEPYYAVLLMDGDSLGKQMSDPERQPRISAALDAFISAVDGIVHRHSGFLVYAGGDDVMALMPVETALLCATELRNHYRQCFNAEQIRSSLSGAIECVHIRQPLTDVLANSHQLLDEIAKDQTGRDALAIRVSKHSGPHLVWSQPWGVLLGESDHPMPDIQALAQRFHATLPGSVFSGSFLYRLITLGEQLDWQALEDDNSTLQAMIVAELARSGVATDGRKVERTLLDTLAQQMLQLGTRYQRQADDAGVTSGFTKAAVTDANALKLLMFLARFCPFQPTAVTDTEVTS